MPVLSPEEAAALGLPVDASAPAPARKTLSAEEATALGLPDTRAPAQVSGAIAFGRGAAQGAQLGFGDEIEGAVQAAGRKLLPESLGGGGEADKKKPIGQLYRESRDVARREYKDAEKAHPGLYLGGQLVGGLAPSVAAGGTWAAAPAYGVAEKLAKGAKTATMAAGLGGAAALGESEAPDVAGEARDALKGAGLGLTLAGIVPAAGDAAKRVLSRVKNGIVQMSPEARYLSSKGAKGLTLGQMAPKSWINSLEQSAESIPVLGDVIKGQRQAGRASWQRAVLNEARPPGAPEVGPIKVGDAVGELLDGFEHAYSPLKTIPVSASVQTPQGSATLAQAFQAAAQDPGVLATDSTRKAVAGFLDNAHTALSKKAASGGLDAGDLLGLRSSIRSEIRQALSGPQPDYKTAQLLKNGEAAVTSSLESQLPAAESAALKATDQQYSKLMRVADAVRSGADQPGGFTPAQLSRAVKGNTERLSYAKGGGGELRQLASAGRDTLDSTVPPTGARLLQMAAGTPVLSHMTVGLAGLGTTGFGKRLLTGQTGLQRASIPPAMQAIIDALKQRSPYALGSAAETGGEHIAGQ